MTILDVLKQVKQEDLDQIDAQIEQLERELDALKAARQLVHTALHGRKPRKPWTRRTETTQSSLLMAGTVPGVVSVPAPVRPAAPAAASTVAKRSRDDKRPGRVSAKELAEQAEARREQLLDRIFALLQAEGSLPVFEIASKLGETPQMIGITVARSDWFYRTMEGDIQIKKAKG